MTATPDGSALLRQSGLMAIGTILSRVTGLVRTIVLAVALGTALRADAFNIANTAPNIVYDLLLGGVLTSVFVPLLVRAGRRDGTDEEFARRLLSAVVFFLGAATVVMVVFAPQLMHLFVGTKKPDELRMATALARFFLPQIFFYGVGATLGAILNTRGSFAAPMWAPILNNVVAIGTLAVYWAQTTGPHRDSLTAGQIELLGLGTTAGIVAQTLALLPALRAVGFRWRLTTRLRGAGLGEALRLGGWTLVFVAGNQIAYFVVLTLGKTATLAKAPGYSVYTYAYLLFLLPHAIVAVSVISALLPQMSAHASDGDGPSVARDLARGTRLAAAVLVPAAVLFAVLHGPIAQLLFAYKDSAAGAPSIGRTLAYFALGLVPFSAFQLQLRAFYAFADTRTPALINLGVNAANIAVNLALSAALPVGERVYGLAVGFATAYLLGWLLATRVLRRRLGPLGTGRTMRTLVRLGIASAVGGALAAVVSFGAGRLLGHGVAGSATAVVLGGGLAAAVTLALASRMRVAEVVEVVSVVRRRLP